MKKKEPPRYKQHWRRPRFIPIPESFHREIRVKMGWEVGG